MRSLSTGATGLMAQQTHVSHYLQINKDRLKSLPLTLQRAEWSKWLTRQFDG